MRISLSMIVKNESVHLRTALDSVSDVDEIVIVDTGSQDGTPDIAREYTDLVFVGEEFMWRDDFAFHRNQSLDRCTGDWVLVVDADEYMQPGGIDRLRDVISTLPDDMNAVEFETISSTGHDRHWSVRAFRRTDCRWEGAAHNYLTGTRPYRSDIRHYYGYSEAHRLDPDRTLRILAKYCTENPGAARERYYLAREHYYRKNYEEAVKQYEIYLKFSKFTAERADALLMRARCLWQLQRGEQARQSCLQAIYNNPDFGEALRFMSEMHYEPFKSKWKKIADGATDLDVLFKRNH